MVLWGFYKLALEQQAAHHFKRFYLIGSVLISVALPLITWTYTVEAASSLPSQVTQLPATLSTMDVPPGTAPDTIHWLPIIMGFIYSLGALLFGYRFIRNLNDLYQKVKNNEQVRKTSHIVVLLSGKTAPHSFLHYIFLPKQAYKQDKIALELLAHEQAHVSQKHSWDILLIEFLQVVFWFNPLLILVKKNMALNHEFLADQAALFQNNNIKAYTNLLFSYSDVAHHNALTSQINYSLTSPPFQRAKKRILMLSQPFSAKKIATRLTLFLPILALCIYFFSQDIVAKPIYSNQDIKEKSQQSVQGIVEEEKPKTSREFLKQIDIFEVKKENLSINGQPVEIEKLEAELKRRYGKFSQEQLDNQIVIYVQSHNPQADRAKVNIVVGALLKFGINKYVWSASEFANHSKNSKNKYQHVTSGTAPIELPNVFINPEDYVDKMQEMNTTFFYNSGKISAERAKSILKDNNSVQVVSRFSSFYGENPVMQLED
ncbi:hypothetical protein APR41_13135 [Salegentibacter salinarum]|uniref:Peptidase M56 domain-containing protein n=1 Tax=Salegentibacter salinarum TaxID=447422 RepID=A0A2N0U0T5_9FLAO|nr:hypothetical protein APR41_13135 [Salegentibacter salinarum]